jgi:DNA-binding CsgD family transcriptional regulator
MMNSEVGGTTVYAQLAMRAAALQRFWRQGPDAVCELDSASFPLRRGPLEAVLAAEEGDLARAAALAAGIKQALPKHGRGLLWLSNCLPFLACCATLEDEEGMDWLGATVPFSGRLFDWHLVDIELARTYATANQWEQAAAHFKRAEELCIRGELHAFRGQVYLYRGLMLLKRREPGDRQAALRMLEEAHPLFAELGMNYLVQKTEGILGQPARGRRADQGPGGLTQRELAVLKMLAGGETNRDIASALYISERTVERHLDNVYRKLGRRSRGAAAAWYAGQGLPLAGN